MTQIIHINTVQTMTSLEIAELTGKQHKNVMQAIRNMEPAWENAWEKVNGLKFQLVEYRDAKGELRPCYQLTKTECLYIATKFNDEARARLVLRWEELESEKLKVKSEKFLPEPRRILVAKTFNMTVWDFNCLLRDMGIQYRRHGRWNISDDLAGRDLVRLRTHVSYSLKGQKKVRTYMTWTMNGLRFLNSKLGYPNF